MNRAVWGCSPVLVAVRDKVRHRPFALALGLGLALSAPLQAAPCHGKNLIAALPAADLRALKGITAVPFAHGNLWQARKGKAQITLVGTYHLADARFDATLTTLAPYLAQAKALLVEAGPAEQAALHAAVTRDPSLIYLTHGPTLPAQMSAADWDQVAHAVTARGMAPDAAATMQPWLLMAFVDVPACLFPLPTGADQGLDKRLIELALAKGLPIAPLEPFNAVVKVFAQIPRADQLAMLRQTVAMDAQSDDMATTLADSYFAGDSRLFWAYMGQESAQWPGISQTEVDRDMALIEQSLITDRNVAWVPVLEDAAQKGPILAAFGALHLPGEAGVLNLLAKHGWTLQALSP